MAVRSCCAHQPHCGSHEQTRSHCFWCIDIDKLKNLVSENVDSTTSDTQLMSAVAGPVKSSCFFDAKLATMARHIWGDQSRIDGHTKFPNIPQQKRLGHARAGDSMHQEERVKHINKGKRRSSTKPSRTTMITLSISTLYTKF